MSERLVFRLLVILVCLAPLPLGSNRPWSWSLLSLAAGLLLVAWAVAMSRRAPAAAPVPLTRILPVFVPFGLATGWAAVQASGLTPGIYDHPSWELAGQALGQPVPGAISVEPAAAWAGLMRLFAYAAVFWLALQLCRDRDRARRALWAVVLACGLYGLYGMVADLSGSNAVLWYEKVVYRDVATGPFINRNSFATYLGLGLVGALGLALDAWRHALVSVTSRRQQLRRSIEAVTRHGGLLLVAVILLSTLLLTESRAGFAAGGLGVATIILLHLGGRGLQVPGLRSFAIALAAGAVALFALSGEQTAERLAFDHTSTFEYRQRAYEVTLQAIGTAPWLGTGLGTFERIFPLHQPFLVGGYWDKAHNSYLENALELGVPATALLVLAVALAVLHCVRGMIVRRRDRVFPAVAIAASILVGSHAVVDFSMQIPAVAMTYAFLLGLGCAQSWGSREFQGARSAPAASAPKQGV